jgi:hypothetical protein
MMRIKCLNILSVYLKAKKFSQFNQIIARQMIKRIISYFYKKEKSVVFDFFTERKIDQIYYREYRNTNLKYNKIFDLGDNIVFYFDKESDSELNEYFRVNYNLIKEQFKNKGRDFYHVPSLIENKDNFIVPLLKECFPEFSDLSLLAINENLKNKNIDYSGFLIEFFDYINYRGNIKKGFVSSNEGFTLVEHKDNETIDQFVNNYIKHLPTNSNNQHIYYSLDKKSLQSLQKETVENYDIIKSALERLRENGELLIIAPQLYKLLENNVKGIRFEDVAPLTVTKDFKILISNNENLEIKLSHLTKTVYVFFLIQTEAVDIKDLRNYEKLLLSIYKNISNQLSLDKMKESIQDLVNPENEYIYTHISRIKKEIQNHFEPHIAHQYFIDGEKGKPKKINLLKDKITFEQRIL